MLEIFKKLFGKKKKITLEEINISLNKKLGNIGKQSNKKNVDMNYIGINYDISNDINNNIDNNINNDINNNINNNDIIENNSLEKNTDFNIENTNNNIDNNKNNIEISLNLNNVNNIKKTNFKKNILLFIFFLFIMIIIGLLFLNKNLFMNIKNNNITNKNFTNTNIENNIKSDNKIINNGVNLKIDENIKEDSLGILTLFKIISNGNEEIMKNLNINFIDTIDNVSFNGENIKIIFNSEDGLDKFDNYIKTLNLNINTNKNNKILNIIIN